MEKPVKGSVTSISSLIPVEEAQKASKRVQETISERQKQLDQLQGFVADNNSLINLVQRLPDQLHHDIIVPFGKAAFFPGRLIHTNEFLVLLGEGHYAERTSKQTNEILNRRGKALESQVESVKALMQDLKAEASFFDATASEAAEGLVEIREDYVEETPPKEASRIGTLKAELPISSEAEDIPGAEDEEYNRILSRISELEKEEEEAENDNEFDGEDLGRVGSDVSTSHDVLAEEVKISEVHNFDNLKERAGSSIIQPMEKVKISEVHNFDNLKERAGSSIVQSIEGFSDQWHVEGSKASSKEDCLLGNITYGKFNLTENAPTEPQAKEDVKAPVIADNKAAFGPSKPHFDSSEVFVVSNIIEHASDININPKEQTVSRSTRPVSRFKMQRK